MMNQHNVSFWHNMPPVTRNLIIINALLWVATLLMRRIGVNLMELLGLHFFMAEHFNPMQLVSYMFLHDTNSISHLFFNMFAVFMFGTTLERLWGSKRFLIFYMITGIGAGLVQEVTWLWSLRDLLTGSIDMINLNGQDLITKKEYYDLFITVGASGAVFGILLAFGMNFPNSPLYIMFIPIPVKAKYVVAGYGLIELFAGITNFSGDPIAHFAHLGGMLFGFIMILYWKKTNRFGNNGRYF